MRRCGRRAGCQPRRVVHYTSDGLGQIVGSWGLAVTQDLARAPATFGAHSLEAIVQKTLTPDRIISRERVSGELGCEVGAPVLVEDGTWGSLIVQADHNLSPSSEATVARFAEMIATAVVNGMARSQLLASRRASSRLGTRHGDTFSATSTTGLNNESSLPSLTFNSPMNVSIPTPKQREQDCGPRWFSLRRPRRRVRELAAGLHPAF